VTIDVDEAQTTVDAIKGRITTPGHQIG